MNKRKLHLQADRIEMVLQSHKAPARVTGGRVTPRTIQFHVTPAPSTRISKVEALSEEIALALGAPSARISRSNGQIHVEVPRADALGVNFVALAKQLARDEQLARALRVPGTALLGLDSEGIPLMVRLASPEVTHVLIAGTTGSGKTEAAKTLLASLMYFQKPREIQILLIDPKGTAFKGFENFPHLLTGYIRDTESALLWLRWLEAEMERRQREEIMRPRIVLVLDELADLLMEGGKELQVHLTRLAQRGRSAGISIIACTQKPTVDAIGSLVKANFPVRLVGKVTSAEEARIAAGIGGTDAEKLAGRGDFILVAGGQMVRFQAAFLTPEQYAELRERAWLKGTAPTRQLGIVSIINRLARKDRMS